jgi:hypothetical protein
MRNLKTVDANFMLKCLERIYRKHSILFLSVVGFLLTSFLSNFVPWEKGDSTINAVLNGLSPELRWVCMFLFYGVMDILYMLEYVLTLNDHSYQLFFLFSTMVIAFVERVAVGFWLRNNEQSREEQAVIHFLLENVIFFVMAVAFFSTAPRMYHAFPNTEWSEQFWTAAVMIMFMVSYRVMVYFGSYLLMASVGFCAIWHIDAVLALPSVWKVVIYTVVTLFAVVAMEYIASAAMGLCRHQTKESS